LSSETVVGNVLVVQVCWEAVADTWPGTSKAPVCALCTEMVKTALLQKIVKHKPEVLVFPNTISARNLLLITYKSSY